MIVKTLSIEYVSQLFLTVSERRIRQEVIEMIISCPGGRLEWPEVLQM